MPGSRLGHEFISSMQRLHVILKAAHRVPLKAGLADNCQSTLNCGCYAREGGGEIHSTGWPNLVSCHRRVRRPSSERNWGDSGNFSSCVKGGIPTDATYHSPSLKAKKDKTLAGS